MSDEPRARSGGPADRVVTLRRLFPAPPRVLFRAWTDPAVLAKWWAPKNCVAHRCELDVRPGGRWRTWFRCNQGPERYVGGVYREVIPLERLVFTWEPDGAEGKWDRPTLVTVEFHDRGGSTEIVLTHQELKTGEAHDMEPGWTSTFDCLEDYIRKLPAHDRLC